MTAQEESARKKIIHEDVQKQLVLLHTMLSGASQVLYALRQYELCDARSEYDRAIGNAGARLLELMDAVEHLALVEQEARQKTDQPLRETTATSDEEKENQ